MSEGDITPVGSGNLDAFKVSQLPAAFKDIGEKHNALVGLISAINGRAGITVNVSAGNIIISLDDNAPSGAGLPDGYTFEEFTICDSGTPATRWWPTWLTNPEA